MNSYTIQSLFFKFLSKYDDAPAFTFLPTGETLTYRDLKFKIDSIAGYLYKLGLRPGTHFMCLLPSNIDFLLFSLAGVRCGATMTSLNDMLAAKQVEFILNDVVPEIIVVGTLNQVPTVQKYLKEAKSRVSAIGIPGANVEYPAEFITFDWKDAQIVPDLPQASPSDIARINYTGGTTGVPKGVMHSQGSVGADLLAHCMEGTLDDLDRILLCMPLQHAAGPTLWVSLASGAHVFYTNQFEPADFLNILKEKKINSTLLVPTMLYRVLDQGKKMNFEINTIRNINYGAAPISPQRLKEAFELFGPVMKQSYGLTECPNLVARLSKADHVWAYNNKPEVLTSCGKPAMMAYIRLVDDNGNDVPPLERGEIIVKSPYTMVGYYKRPDLTKETLRDGWLYTGDIGKFDEHGFLYLVDRKKDMIISGGMNVYSVEVEKTVNLHPAVAMSACIGVPHDDWGEAVCVHVVLKEGASCTEEELINYCKSNTAKYMVPKMIKFVEALPLTLAGKIDKKEIRKAAWAGRERQIN